MLHEADPTGEVMDPPELASVEGMYLHPCCLDRTWTVNQYNYCFVLFVIFYRTSSTNGTINRSRVRENR